MTTEESSSLRRPPSCVIFVDENSAEAILLSEMAGTLEAAAERIAGVTELHRCWDVLNMIVHPVNPWLNEEKRSICFPCSEKRQWLSSL